MNDMSQAPSVKDGEKKKESPIPKPTFERERTFSLSIPIERPAKNGSGMEVISKLTLRTPLAIDIFDIGGTVTQTSYVKGAIRVAMDAQLLREWIKRLSGEDGTVIGQMAGRDIKLIYDWLSSELSQIEGN